MDFFPNNNVKLTSVQKDSCEGQITEEELQMMTISLPEASKAMT
jgi:hypothetical protein